MSTYRLKILAALIISFLIVEGYAYYTKHPSVVANVGDNAKNLLSNLKFKPGNIIKLFSLNFSPTTSNQSPTTSDNQDNSFNLPTYDYPTAFPTKPTPTNTIIKTPTIRPRAPTPTSSLAGNDDELVDFPIEDGDDAQIAAKPTAKPKPTKPPTLPAITSDLRPGTSLKEIFQEVNKRACFPTALLMAFKSIETGQRFMSDKADTIKTYNTYGWWITGKGDPCYGYGYYTQSGIVPPDSVSAGTSCNSPIGDPTDLKIMGLTQISEWEQEVAQKYIKGIIPKNDRRVFFDNALIFAFITRSRVGDPPKNCDDWPDDMVRLAAEKHLGSGCQYYYSQNGASGDYCKQILDKYKEYKKSM